MMLALSGGWVRLSADTEVRQETRAGREPPAARIFASAGGALVLILLFALVPVSDSPPHKLCSPPTAPDHQCRLWAMIGTDPPDSLLADQLVSGTHSLMTLGDANPNGWGLGYFSPALQSVGWEGPALVRGGPPASHDHDPRFAAAVARMLALDPTCGVAHLRRSSGAHSGVPDPHPFWRDGLALAHNGLFSTTGLTALLEADDPDYLDIYPPDYKNAYIDSELFLLYILKLRATGVEPAAPRASGFAERDRSRSRGLADAVNQAVFRAYDAGVISTAANCVVTTGDTLVGVRFDLGDAEVYKLRYRELPGAWVIASEPLGTDTAGWEEFPPKSLGIFTASGPPEFVTIFPPPDPYVVVGSTVVDDDQLGDSYGNGDGDADAGERIELVITLRNEGYEIAPQARATLATTDSLCQVLDGEEQYGDIPAQGELPCLEDFDLHIDPACPDGHEISFTLTVECDGPFLWERPYTLRVHAPEVAMDHYEIEDQGSGDGNGRIEPGETFRLATPLENRGAQQATHLQLSLEIFHPQASILQGAATLDTLPGGAVATPSPPFEISLAMDCPAWDVVYARIDILGDWELDTSVAFLLPVGGFHDDMESGSGAWTSHAINPQYVNQWHLSSFRNYTPAGTWSRKFGGAGGGDYANRAAGALESEPVPLHAYSYLRFRHWMEAEISQTLPGRCYDGGLVEMMGADSSWQPLSPVGGYPYTVRNADGTSPFPPNTPVYSGNVDWEEAIFEIVGHTGEGRFRFVFGTDGTNVREGWYIDNVEFFGGDSLWSGVDELRPLILYPALGSSRPNPGAPGLRIQFDVPAQGVVGLDVYDIAGRRVRTLVAGTLPPGRHEVPWDGRDQAGRAAASGTYFCRFSCGGVTAARRLVLAR